MKRLLIPIFATALLVPAGCSEPDTAAPADGSGRILLGNTVDTRIDTRAAAVPQAGDFSLRITGDGFDRTWERVGDFPAEETYFAKGTYTASVAWGDPDAEGPDACSYYGETEFEIVPRRTTPVSVTARIAHSMVVVRATEAFMRYFHDARFTVATASGNSFEFVPDAATLSEIETGDGTTLRVTQAAPVGVKAATTLRVAGTALRQTGDEVAFPEQTLAETVPCTCHIFTFDAAGAGSATLTIYLGEAYTETRTLTIELNDGAIPQDKE